MKSNRPAPILSVRPAKPGYRVLRNDAGLRIVAVYTASGLVLVETRRAAGNDPDRSGFSLIDGDREYAAVAVADLAEPDLVAAAVDFANEVGKLKRGERSVETGTKTTFFYDAAKVPPPVDGSVVAIRGEILTRRDGSRFERGRYTEVFVRFQGGAYIDLIGRTFRPIFWTPAPIFPREPLSLKKQFSPFNL